MVLIQIMCLEDLARAAELAAILLLCHGNEGMSRTFYLSVAFVQCTVALLSPSLCHLPHRKTCQLSKQFLSCSASDYFGKQTCSSIADNFNIKEGSTLRINTEISSQSDTDLPDFICQLSLFDHLDAKETALADNQEINLASF